MSDQLVHIAQRKGTIKRVQLDETPIIELYLAVGQYVVGVTLEKQWDYSAERKTADWDWAAFVVTPLGMPS
jgi:hypothetical protein